MADSFALKAIISAVDKMSPVLKAISTGAKTSKKYISDLANATNGLTSKVGLPLTALSGLITGFGAGAIKHAMESYAETGEQIYKGSLKAGMGAEQYQRLKYVFEQSGVAVDSMEMSMGKLNKNIGLASVGKNKDVVNLFKQLKIPMRDSNKQLRTAADLLPQLADAFVRNKNPILQARMGNALFGKAWAEVLPLLVEGSEGIETLTKRFGKLKGVMSLEDAKTAKDWGDLMSDLSVVTKGFQVAVAKELVPVLSPLVDDLILWAGANKKLIAADVKSFVKGLVAEVKGFDWHGLVDGANSAIDALKWMVGMVGGARNALILLVVVMNLQTIQAALGLAGAMYRAGGALLGLALSAAAPLAPLQTLSASLVAAEVSGGALLGTVGRLAAVAGVVGAAFAGWKIGGWINDNVINPAVSSLTGVKDNSLGNWVYDLTHKDPFADSPAPLVNSRANKVTGEIKVSFDDAPPGMRVVQTSASGGVDVNPNVGYRSLSTGSW